MKELQFFGLAVLRGILLLVIYDLIRIFRRIVPHGVLAVSVEDILYWVSTAVLIFQLLYQENDGALRGYALFAVVVGMLFYHQTVSNWLVSHISGILRRVFDILLKPFRSSGRKIVQVLKVVVRFNKKKLKKQLKEFIIILFS